MRKLLSRMADSRLVRNAGWQLVQTVSATGVELLILLAFAARLDALEFGRLAIALSTVKIVFLLLEARIHEYLVPKFIRFQQHRPTAAWAYSRWCRSTEMFLNVLALLGCLAVAAAASFHEFGLSPTILAASGFYTFAGGFGKFSSLGILRCTESVRIAAIHSLVSGVGKLATLAVGFALSLPLGLQLLTLALPALAVSVSQVIFANAAAKVRLGPPKVLWRFGWSSGRMRQDLRLLASNYATGLVEIAYREADLQLVAALSSAIEAGRYRVAKTLGMLTLEALSPLVLVMLPELSHRIHAGLGMELRRFLARVTAVLGAMSVTAAAASLLVSWFYLTFVAPVQKEAITPLLIFLGGFTLTGPFLWTQSFHVATGKPHFYLASSIAGAMGALLLAAILVPGLGAMGGAIAQVSGLAVVAILSMSGVYLTLRRTHVMVEG